jgi:hypothetical protein
VLYALVELIGTDQQRLERLRTARTARTEDCGSFADGIIWSGNVAGTTVQA